jgi:hypothetical protein
LSETNTLWAEATLGRDAEEFMSSDIGRYLLGRCEQDIQDAVEKLSVVSPWRRNRIRQLQNEIWRAQSVRGWLAELVGIGRQAETILDEDR